ncbi:16S rRNA processing protein RimM [Crassaminicella thermophila]|uniref:Ribosome maturation factor RimM n=1 Tax=Crassaminicella thermophila TaxID=2599308 RepID=A0A5C0SBU7_CRATE|nr:ribosome maturation factor RimM [Crassaminicella thermophila]QEK12033.1 16S rRNA processing protein RimM [Crassaminicella thermophila]
MPKLLKVGQIVNAQGIRGEVKVYPLTDYKERFEELDWVYMGDNIEEKFYIEKVKYKNELVILKLKGIDDRNMAERCKTKYLMIDKKDARELPEDTYFIVDLIGLKVYTNDKILIGTIKNVIQNTGQDLYEIEDHKNPKKTILIPAVEAFIKEVNIEKGYIIVTPIEGLIE